MPAPSSIRGQLVTIVVLVVALVMLLLNRERCARGIANTFEVVGAPQDGGPRTIPTTPPANPPGVPANPPGVPANPPPAQRKVDPNLGRRATPIDGGAPLGAPTNN